MDEWLPYQIAHTKNANTNVFSFVRNFVSSIREGFAAPQMLANAA